MGKMDDEQAKMGNPSEEKYTALHVSGTCNSTLFTNCCGLAVGRRDTKCPGCGTRIVELRKVIS